MRRRDVLALGASLVGALAARRALAQPRPSLARAAVVIGVDKAGDLTPLRAAVSGARIFADWLEAEEFEVKRFFDDGGAVAVAEIKSAVKEFVGRGTLDQLVIYFAGHGCLINRSERWLLSDAPEDPDAAISFAESYDLAQQAQIPNVVFISDACRSTPASLRIGQIDGSIIFPNPGGVLGQLSPKVDKFFAARPGQEAFEVPIEESASQYEAIYTSVFLDAFTKPDSDMVLELEGGLRVVPNRKLENYLFREVRRRAEAASLRIHQLPWTDVVSTDETYIGRLSVESQVVAAAPAPEPTVSDVVSAALVTVDASLTNLRSDYSQESLDALANESGFTEARGRILAAPSASGVSTGFMIAGTTVSDVVAPPGVGVSVEIVESILASIDLGARTIVRVDQGGDAATVAIRFADGSGTVAACLNHFVGSITIEGGLVSNVSYDGEGMAPDEYIRQLRATVAAAAQLGIFRIQGQGEERTRQAQRLGDTLRMGKFADPTLGLYAAYAYNEAALRENIRSVAEIMRSDLGVLLFDVAMLDGKLSGEYAGILVAAADSPHNIFPQCPMLAQGWSLLRVRDVRLPEAYESARAHLLQALWTTFAPPGMDIVEAALRDGRLR